MKLISYIEQYPGLKELGLDPATLVDWAVLTLRAQAAQLGCEPMGDSDRALANRLGLPIQHVRRLCTCGEFPGAKLSSAGRWYIPPDVAVAYVVARGIWRRDWKDLVS